MPKLKPKKVTMQSMLVIGVMLLLLCFGSLVVFFPFNHSSINKELTQTRKTIQEIYSSNDIFAEIEYAKRQHDASLTTLGDETYFVSEKAHNEIMRIPSDRLAPLKCMPEQIYINRAGYKHVVLSSDSPEYKPVEIHDSFILSTIDRLEHKLPEGYALTQFFLCKTEDNRVIAKYNSIIDENQQTGYQITTRPTAFISQISPDGIIQDLSYITIEERAFCRYPIQLTKDNQFYLACNSHDGQNGNGTINSSFVYRINLNTLGFSLISRCYNTHSDQPICEE